MKGIYLFFWLGFIILMPICFWLRHKWTTRFERFIDTFTGEFNNKMNGLQKRNIQKMNKGDAHRIMTIIAKHQDEQGVLYEYCWYCSWCVGDFCFKHGVNDPWNLCTSWNPKYSEMFK